jgi:organic radical activating enzyme
MARMILDQPGNGRKANAQMTPAMHLAHKTRIRMHSLFESISGEAGTFPQGTWVTFVRMQGCNLHCAWCDTAESRPAVLLSPVDMPTVLEVAEQIVALGNRRIVITGGEPTEQMEALRILANLLIVDHHCAVQIETNGSNPIPNNPYGNNLLTWVMDYKTPSSGMQDKMQDLLVDGQVGQLAAQGVTVIKFVIADENDLLFFLDWAKQIKSGAQLPLLLALSPTPEMVDDIPEMVRVMRREFPAMPDFCFFSVQLHKLLGMA